MSSLTRRFLSDKRLFRDFSEFNSKLAEHRTSIPATESQIARTHVKFANGATRLLFDSERSLKSLPSLLSDLPQTIFQKYLTVLYCIYDVRGSWQANAFGLRINHPVSPGIYGEHCDVLLDDTLYPQSDFLHLRYRHICGQS